jgi:hypothetical protein
VSGDGARTFRVAPPAAYDGHVGRYGAELVRGLIGFAGLGESVGFAEIRSAELTPSVRYSSFEELWAPFTSGVAPSGAYTVSLDESGREALRREFHRRLGRPDGPFVLTARAWAVVGRR